ncbi:16427_t:CDS:2, partial [Racocetra persica]
MNLNNVDITLPNYDSSEESSYENEKHIDNSKGKRLKTESLNQFINTSMSSMMNSKLP